MDKCSQGRIITMVISLTGLQNDAAVAREEPRYGATGAKANLAFSGDSASCSGLCGIQLKCSTIRKTAGIPNN